MVNEKAFPVAWNENLMANPGMDLRDYFAAKVLQGWAANLNYELLIGDMFSASLAAYDIADAMMEARNHNKQEN